MDLNTFIPLSSADNPAVKAAAKLKETKERRKSGRILLEGRRLCLDAVRNGVGIEALFVTERAGERIPEIGDLAAAARKRYLITPALSRKLADTEGTQAVFCVCETPENRAALIPGGFYLLTDAVQTPDNLGALARTAEAFGLDGMFVCDGCDPYQPKALRAAMGALLRLPVSRADAAETVRTANTMGLATFAAALDAQATDIRETAPFAGGLLVVGNEGNGISPEVLSLCRRHVVIPMAGAAESLNAAVAGGIAMWELMKKWKVESGK